MPENEKDIVRQRSLERYYKNKNKRYYKNKNK